MLEKFNTPYGVIIFSILIGLGLAGLFRQVCDGSDCEKTIGPNLRDVEGTSYRIGEKCYLYQPEVVSCEMVDSGNS